MPDRLNTVGAITMLVADRARAKEFYERVFDADVRYEDEASVVFGFGELMINLLVEPAAVPLLAPAQPGSADAGPRVQLTIEVADTDAVCARLAAAGVALLNGPQDRPWGIRTAAFLDPDGHVWEVAAPLA